MRIPTFDQSATVPGMGLPISRFEAACFLTGGVLLGLLIGGGLAGSLVGLLLAALAVSEYQGVFVLRRILLSHPNWSDGKRWLVYVTAGLLIVPTVLIGLLSALRNAAADVGRAGDRIGDFLRGGL